MTDSVTEGAFGHFRFRGLEKWILRVLLVSFILASRSFGGSNGLLSQKTQDALLKELSGERGLDYVTMISRFERIQASEGWHNAALYVKSQLDKVGYTDAHIEGWPSNGETWYYTWQTPIGWRARSATLWMLEPYQKKLGDYEEIPNSLVKHSGPADVTAELVDVGSGVDSKEYHGKDVRGKIVMAFAYSGSVAREAIKKRGAVGMVTYIPEWDRKDHPDLLQYTAIWPKWSERDSLGFGFNVSKYDAQELLSLLRGGKKVVLKARVDSDFYESQIEMLTATIRGSAYPDQEILVCGHLDHPQPSANDNASGSAGLLEMARALKTLIDRGEIDPPRRTIRFLWVSEYYGTVAYLKAHPDFGRKTVAAINCDMIGEDLMKTDSYFYATRTPDSRPSFLTDVIEYFVKLTATLPVSELRGSNAPFNYRIVPYAGGSDHYFFNDASIGVPSTMLGHPDPFHHTAQDTPDKVDPTELKRVCFIAAASAWFMANASDVETERLLLEMYRGSLERFVDDLTNAEAAMYSAQTPDELFTSYKDALNVTKYSGRREVKSLQSASILAASAHTKEYIDESATNLKRFEQTREVGVKELYDRLCRERGIRPRNVEITPEEQAAMAITPVRSDTFKCPLGDDYLVQKLGKELVESLPSLTGDAAWEAVNFVDGKRNLLEVYEAVKAEYGESSLQMLKNYFSLLEKAGLISLVSK
ncbi:MAG: M28 family peptidase [Bacteroidota bacterium]